MQHIVEVAVVSVSGALLGLALGAAGLAGVQAIYTQDNTYGMLAHFDPLGIAWALALAAAVDARRRPLSRPGASADCRRPGYLKSG